MNPSHFNLTPKKYLYLFFLSAISCLLIGGGDASAQSPCGDGTLNLGEECEFINGDPSSGVVVGSNCDRNSCIIPGEPLECTCRRQTTSICGNGQLCSNVSACFPLEECDDGNFINGDGCDSRCQLENICGDEIISGEEACDGDNSDCSPGEVCVDCQCVTVCGDGTLRSPEQCDVGSRCDNGNSCNISQNLTPNVPGSNLSCGFRLINGQLVLGSCGPRSSGICSSTCRFQCVGGRANGFLEPFLKPEEKCDPLQSASAIANECPSNFLFSFTSLNRCSSTCRCAICGNGIVAGSDECDEGAKCDDGTSCTICDLDNNPTGDSCITDPCTGKAFDPEDPSRCRERESSVCTEDCMLKCDPDHKSMVCHNNSKILCIDNHAVDAHLNHGDTEVGVDQSGSCPPEQAEEQSDEENNETPSETPMEEGGDSANNEPSAEVEEIDDNGTPASEGVDTQTISPSTATGGCALIPYL